MEEETSEIYIRSMPRG